MEGSYYGVSEEGKSTSVLTPLLFETFITRLIGEGIDIATVARISGNSTKTIVEHYLAARSDFEVPEL